MLSLGRSAPQKRHPESHPIATDSPVLPNHLKSPAKMFRLLPWPTLNCSHNNTGHIELIPPKSILFSRQPSQGNLPFFFFFFCFLPHHRRGVREPHFASATFPSPSNLPLPALLSPFPLHACHYVLNYLICALVQCPFIG